MIIATHLAIHSCSGLFCSPRILRKHALVDAFLLYLHKNSIGHLLKTSWDYFSSKVLCFCLQINVGERETHDLNVILIQFRTNFV